MSVAEQLVALEKKKSFLGEFCCSIACQLLDACPESICREHLLGALELSTGWVACTTERLQVLLHVSKLYSKVCGNPGPPNSPLDPPVPSNPQILL